MWKQNISDCLFQICYDGLNSSPKIQPDSRLLCMCESPGKLSTSVTLLRPSESIIGLFLWFFFYYLSFLTRLHLVSMLRMCVAVPPLPLYACIACTGTAVPSPLSNYSLTRISAFLFFSTSITIQPRPSKVTLFIDTLTVAQSIKNSPPCTQFESSVSRVQ